MRIDVYRNANTRVEHVESCNEAGIRRIRSYKQSPSRSTATRNSTEAGYDRQAELFGRTCLLRRVPANSITSPEGAVDGGGCPEREAGPVLLLPRQIRDPHGLRGGASAKIGAGGCPSRASSKISYIDVHQCVYIFLRALIRHDTAQRSRIITSFDCQRPRENMSIIFSSRNHRTNEQSNLKKIFSEQ